MGKKKEKEKKPYISDRLRKLIYNPELPPNWQPFLPDYEKVFMFQKLFLLLNEDFQKEFGKEIDEWFSIYEAVEKHDENYLSNHPWLIVNKKERYIRYKICDECTKNGKLQCKMRIDPRSLIYILIHYCPNV